MGKLHGTLAKAGKVRKQTPKIAKKQKKRGCRGRALKRIKYNRRFTNIVEGTKRKSPNFRAGRPQQKKEDIKAKPVDNKKK